MTVVEFWETKWIAFVSCGLDFSDVLAIGKVKLWVCYLICDHTIIYFPVT